MLGIEPFYDHDPDRPRPVQPTCRKCGGELYVVARDPNPLGREPRWLTRCTTADCDYWQEIGVSTPLSLRFRVRK